MHMPIGEMTGNDNIKVEFTERGGMGWLLFKPPTKLRGRGWVNFQRGPFVPAAVQDQLAAQGLTLQEMVLEYLECTPEELAELPYETLESAVDFYRA